MDADGDGVGPSGSPAILYKWPEAHGLPSSSPACLQAEAYLRMTKQPFVICNCASANRSPTGQLPALEVDGVFPASDKLEFDAARACVALGRRRVRDLDQHLTPPQRAELLAFATLVQSKLDAAAEFSIWMEPKGYQAHTRVAYSSQPFPLNLLMPWYTRRDVARRYIDTPGDTVYAGALAALKALTERLRGSVGRYLMGDAPSSLDALVFGHLLFLRTSPCAAPVLQTAVTSSSVLTQYVDHILGSCFSSPVPVVGGSSSGGSRGASASGAPTEQPAGGASSSSSSSAGGAAGGKWSDAAKGTRKPEKIPELTALEKEFRRRSYWWLGGAASVIAGYFLLSGRYNVGQLVQAFQQVVHDADDDDEDYDDEPHDDGDD